MNAEQKAIVQRLVDACAYWLGEVPPVVAGRALLAEPVSAPPDVPVAQDERTKFEAHWLELWGEKLERVGTHYAGNTACAAWDAWDARAALGASPPAVSADARDAARALDHGLNKGVAMWLKNFIKPGEKVIWREPFRWKDEDGVLSNHYEMFDLPQLADDFGYEIVEDFRHAAIVRASMAGTTPAGKENGK